MSDITYAPVQGQPRLAALVLLLQDVLRERGSVTFTVGPDLESDRYAETVFATSTVTFDPDLDQVEFTESVCHELLHVLRGPALVDEEEAEEAEVERLATGLLYGADDVFIDQDAHRRVAALIAAVNRPARPQLVLLPGGAQ